MCIRDSLCSFKYITTACVKFNNGGYTSLTNNGGYTSLTNNGGYTSLTNNFSLPKPSLARSLIVLSKFSQMNRISSFSLKNVSQK